MPFKLNRMEHNTFFQSSTVLQKKHVTLFFQLKHLQKYDFQKPQVKITSRSKIMPVFVFQCDVIVYNSLLHRNKRLLISEQVFRQSS